MRSHRFEPVWRSALTVAGLFASIFTVLFVSLIPGMSADAFYLAAGAGVTACAIGLTWCVQRVVEGRSWTELGLSVSHRSITRALLGVAAGAAAVCAANAACVALGAAEWDPDASLASVPAWLTVIVPAALLVQAVPEELWFRGYLFRHLSASLPLWATVAVTAGLFGALHIISQSGAGSLPEKLLYVVQAAAFGLVLVACRITTGELWLAVGFHAGYDMLNERLITPGEGLYSVNLVCLIAVLTAAAVLTLRRRHRRAPLAWRARPAAAAVPAAAEATEERPLVGSAV
ncbi:CPBP family intramembrane glutamic endopeptidase [Planomonospora sp. ID82291]|uniref:CPBP family intramembrane glutamic endopeptidase n=1 Tax=Planomonospora sp. ID82291 TaxID=2738136 RepID=UPI0018C3E609|nr:CPBP family intramembrane glutamic endopeptidase [Planomonospora sp. ID82291]MBG0813907.1 CPBP family intramembrane metalloprotease [Planomonospora sp. ID82291]